MNQKTNRVLLSIPCGDGRIEALTMLAVMNVTAAAGGCTNLGEAIPIWGDTLRGPFMLCNNSNIRDARNRIAHYFKTRTLDCDRLVMIDSDIAFSVEDFMYLLEGDEDIVIAPYSKKAIGEAPVEWGCGFARVSRRVFEKLDAWMNEEGSEALPRYFLTIATGEQPEMAVDYFFDGAAPDGRWFGEDAGFWHWCALNDLSFRKETRTRLVHIGKFYFCYPDQTPGLIPVSAGAQ